MYKYTKNLLLIVALSFIAIAVSGQGAKSPFTARGIGDVYDMSLAHNQAMGGIGISNGNYWYLNNMNPALLAYNTLTVFSAGFVGERRTVNNGVLSETNSGGNLNYLAMAFPVKPGRWTTSIGLVPYSDVNYKFSYFGQVQGSDTTVRITEEGQGGFNQFYWSNGVALNKRFFIGMRVGYLFSGIEKKFSNQLIENNTPSSFSPSSVQTINASGFLISGGIAFNKDSIFNNKVRFKAGLTYELQSDVRAKSFQTWGLQVNGTDVFQDTLQSDSRDMVLPQAMAAGISFNNGAKWSAGIDVKVQQWSDYRDFRGEKDESITNSMKIALGGEFAPDPGSVSSYLKRVTYRAGFSYEETPYMINGKQVKDFGINFGWSLPVGRFSTLDMAFKYGKRGDVKDNLISEDYYKIYLGVNFNDQWFIKRKYD